MYNKKCCINSLTNIKRNGIYLEIKHIVAKRFTRQKKKSCTGNGRKIVHPLYLPFLSRLSTPCSLLPASPSPFSLRITIITINIYFVCFQIICIPLFYIQRLCTATRLDFDVTVTYNMYRLSLSYPVELAVHIGQTVTTNATFSTHASTWFHESGFYTKGKVILCIYLIFLKTWLMKIAAFSPQLRLDNGFIILKNLKIAHKKTKN